MTLQELVAAGWASELMGRVAQAYPHWKTRQADIIAIIETAGTDDIEALERELWNALSFTLDDTW